MKSWRCRPLFAIVILVATLAALVTSPGMAAAQDAVRGAGAALFADVVATPGFSVMPDAVARRSRYVRISLPALYRAKVELNLFPGGPPGSFVVVWDQVETTSAGNHARVGHIEALALSSVTLVMNDAEGIVQGSITFPGGFYRIRYTGQGVHLVEELDVNAFPDDIVVPVYPLADVQGAPLGADDGSIIDVLVVYTPAARTAAGGTTAMNALVDLAITETNTSYANSGINQRLRLVYEGEVSYTESGDFLTDLNRLTGTSDGYMDSVHSLRDTYGADVVSLVIEGTQYCGIANLMAEVSSAFASSAFSVTARSCATGYYSFGHELGHNMGADHDWFVDPTNNAPYTYNHGYVAPSRAWRTIMAYGNDCSNCTRIQRWSNPDLIYAGTATGVAEGMFHAADNRKTLNNTAYTVANFRQGISSIAVGQGAPNPQLFIDAFNRSGFSQFVTLPPINAVHRWDCSTCDPTNPSWGKGLIQDFNGTTSGVHDALMVADTNPTFVAQIYGGMWGKFIQLGGLNYDGANARMLGYPTADRNCSDYNTECFNEAGLVSPFGAFYHYQRFQGAVLVLHKSGPHVNQTFEVQGAIRARWQVLGGPSSGSYGLPISDEFAFQGKRRSDFEGGSICWNPSTNQTEDGCVSTTLQVTPATHLVASGPQGGPFAPSPSSYQLSTTIGSANFSISGVPSWLTASATSGTATTSAATITFTVNLSANSLAAGTYGPATITFTNTTNGLGTATRTATLTVNPRPRLTVFPVPTNGYVTDVTATGISCGTGGTGDCTQRYAQGTIVTLTGHPAIGFRVGKWTGCTPINSNTQCTVVMSQARTVTVTFSKPLLTVSPVPTNGFVTATGISCGAGGTGDCTQRYAQGTIVTLTGNPAAGFRVGTWTGCTPINSNTKCTVTMTRARTVSVTFAR